MTSSLVAWLATAGAELVIMLGVVLAVLLVIRRYAK
jgi:hypothetical protein